MQYFLIKNFLPNTDSIELDQILDKMHEHLHIPIEVNADVYVTVDDNVQVADMLTDEEIVESLQGDEEISPVPLSSVAIKSADLLHSYLVHYDNALRSQ